MINLQEGRAGFETISNGYSGADHITRKNIVIAGVPCAWFLPRNAADDHVVIYIHGGGFIFGSIDSHARMVSHIARHLNRKVLMIDYRLAPEHPYPSGINDCAAVIHALHAENPKRRLAIIGDSAGGNLVMATQLKLKETHGPAALYTVVISPWVNLECNTPSYERNETSDIVLSRPFLVEAAKLYAAGHPLTAPMLSPIYGDFTGMSPVLILCGTKEILEDDSKQLYQQLQRCGVETDLHLFTDQLHVWPFMDIHTEASQEALNKIAGFVSKCSLTTTNNVTNGSH